MNKCLVSNNSYFICKSLIFSKISCFRVKASWWGCSKWCFLNIRLAFSRKCGWFIRLRHWFGLFLPCTWIIWVIWRCFWRVVWGQFGQGIRQNYNIFMCRIDTVLLLCVFRCNFCRMLVFRNLLLLIHTSVHLRMFIFFFWLLLCFHNSSVFSTSLFLTLEIFLLFPHCIIITQ